MIQIGKEVYIVKEPRMFGKQLRGLNIVKGTIVDTDPVFVFVRCKDERGDDLILPVLPTDIRHTLEAALDDIAKYYSASHVTFEGQAVEIQEVEPLIEAD